MLVIQKHLTEALPDVRALRPELPEVVNGVIQKATAKQASERYANARAMATALAKAFEEFLALDDQTFLLPLGQLVNPYKGLRAFQEDDAADFFGREALVNQLLARLRETDDAPETTQVRVPDLAEEADTERMLPDVTIVHGMQFAARPLEVVRNWERFLAIVGPSGSGKSSAVRAGLLPTLRQGALPGADKWYVVEMLPGPHPLEELEAALLRIAVNRPENLLDQLRGDENGLRRAMKRVLPAPDSELLLIVDQFEEVFTLIEDPAERTHFLRLLYSTVNDPRSRIRLIITLRADFYDRPLLYPGFSELMRRRTEVIVPLTFGELERAIRAPAERAGMILEAGLVTTIVADVNEQPGALPLLQYALTELFERREGRTLTKSAYRSIGGVLGALGRRAEEVFSERNPNEQHAARQLFLRLVTLGEGTEDTRRRVLRAELSSLRSSEDQTLIHGQPPSSIDSVIDAFGASRLLSFDRDPLTRGPTVEVAHEALIREWPRLREWLAASRADVRMQRLLANAAAEWGNANRDPSFLLHGSRLEQLAGWSAETELALTPDEQAFLNVSLQEQRAQEFEEASRRRRELESARNLAEAQRQRAEAERVRAEEHVRAARRLRQRAIFLAIAFVLAGVLAVVAGGFARQADVNANAARTAGALAVTQQAGAEAASTRAVAEQLNAEAAATQVKAQEATAQASFVQSERLRLAAEAVNVIENGNSGELPALLAIQSLKSGYTPQGDGALVRALSRGFTRHILRGHTDWLQSVAISPDGQYALTASLDGTARLWSIETGQEVHSFIGHTDGIYGVTFSSDGKYALTGSEDKTARLWNVETAVAVQQFIGHEDVVVGVAFSPNGQYVLTGSFDHTARLWNAQTGETIHVFAGHTEGIYMVAFSPDGRYALTGSIDKTARLWNVQTGEEVRKFVGHTDQVVGVAFSPDGKYVLTGSWDTTARLWDIETGQEVRQFVGHSDRVYLVAFSPDGRYVLTSGFDRTARLWDAQTGLELHQFIGHASGVVGVAFSPDGRYVLTGSGDFTARLWDLRQIDQEPRLLVGHVGNVNGALFFSDGKHAVTADGQRGVWVWDLQPLLPKQVAFIPMPPRVRVTSLALSADGRYVLTGNSDGRIRLWDLQQPTAEPRLFDGHTDLVLDVAFSADGKYMLSSGQDGTARLWEVASAEEVRQFGGDASSVKGAAFSPDDRYIVIGNTDGSVQLFDTQTGDLWRSFLGHMGSVESVAFSPDGRYILSGSNDQTARLWDVQSGDTVRIFRGHSAGVLGVAFSPDGRYIATGSGDKTARLWDLQQAGPAIRQFVGHTDNVQTVAFSPDGRLLITASRDRTARIWRVDYTEVIQLACSMLPRDLTPEEREFYAISAEGSTCP